MNWRGGPLTSHEVIVQSIAATTTRTGLTVHAEPGTGTYPAGVVVSDEALAALPVTQHRFRGDWNYTLSPAPPAPAAAPARPARSRSTPGLGASGPDRDDGQQLGPAPSVGCAIPLPRPSAKPTASIGTAAARQPARAAIPRQ